MPRFAMTLVCLALLHAVSAQAEVSPDRERVEAQFRSWLAATVWPDAQRRGISRRTFEAASRSITLDWSLPDLAPPGAPGVDSGSPRQAEFASPGRYFSEGQLTALTRDGRALLRTWGRTLEAVERRYGVPREIVVAIWGRESGYGRAALPHSALRAIATQAFMGRRRSFFYPELLAGLLILEQDHLPLAELRSSWAGALGQTQFLPSKFLRYAVDFDGDGRRDIWNSVPDSLASIANYMREHGWRAGLAWGVEVHAPVRVSCTLEGPDKGRPLQDWKRLGISRVDGGELSSRDALFLLMPAGRLGPAFLVSENFYVLKRYNESDLYALFIGHLADRFGGNSRIAGQWTAASGFTRADVRSMQERLEQRGYDVGGADGLVGFATRVAIGKWQALAGMKETCFPDRDLIPRIR